MKKFSLLILLFIIIYSCSKDEKQKFKFQGGSLRMALDNEPSTYLPRAVMDYYSATVLNQITEGLVGFDPKTLRIIPKIASGWTKSNDGTQYIFTIREGILFHPHEVFSSKKDRSLTTRDVVKSFEMACTLGENQIAPAAYLYAFKDNLKGANDFFEGKVKTISGIQVKGNKLILELIHEDHNFLNKLCNVSASIVSEKIIKSKREKDIIGTGPFMYSERKSILNKSGAESSLVLVKNRDYYLNDEEGNSLPYLDSLVFIFQSRKLEQLEMFEEGKLDLIVGLPTSRITRMLEGRIQDFNTKPPKLILANNPLLESNFYYFNMEDERFKDSLVRKAFNYAIDKDVIGKDILRNQYYDMGVYGIVPPVSKALRGYDFNSIKELGYNYDPQRARELLFKAGYPGGKGFGSVELRYNIDDTHSAVADEFSKQIFQVLGINVNIDGSSFEQLNQDGANGNGDLFRMCWSADYASPESFLMNFYGSFIPEDSTEQSFINKSRYVNHLFDFFFERAKHSENLSDQMLMFSKAETELMKDPPIIPLWYTGNIEITQSYLRNINFNALNYFDFTSVYIKKWTAEEYEAQYKTN